MVTESFDVDAARNARRARIKQRRERRLAALAEAEFRVPINFAVVGVQKAATGTLYRMLARHRMIAGGPEKEMRTFILEHLAWPEPDLSDYQRPARRGDITLAGDATPEYIFWPHALERMHRYRPDMRLIATFRDPIERALSQWSMERQRDPGFPDLPEAIATFDLERVPTEIPAGLHEREHRRRSLFTRGLYGQQLAHGLEIFPREQWLPLDFRDITGDTEATLDRITDFLGTHRFRTYPELRHDNRTSADHGGRAPTASDIGRLVEVYAEDLPVFAELSGIDVSGWSTSRVVSGDLALDAFVAQLNAKLWLERR